MKSEGHVCVIVVRRSIHMRCLSFFVTLAPLFMKDLLTYPARLLTKSSKGEALITGFQLCPWFRFFVPRCLLELFISQLVSIEIFSFKCPVHESKIKFELLLFHQFSRFDSLTSACIIKDFSWLGTRGPTPCASRIIFLLRCRALPYCSVWSCF